MLDPRSAAALEQATTLAQSGRLEEAKNALRRHLQRFPRDLNAIVLLSRLHSRCNEGEQALFQAERAAELAPREPSAQVLLADLLHALDRHAKAVEVYRRAIALDPAQPYTHDQCARSLLMLGKVEEALDQYERGMEATGRNYLLYWGMSYALSKVGRVEDAILALRKGIAAHPQNLDLHAGLAYELNFPANVSDADHLAAHRRVGEICAANAAGLPEPTFTCTKDPDRRLKVAFLSSDFGEHACGLFLWGLVNHLPAQGVDVFLYSVNEREDAMTPRFKAAAAWRDCRTMQREQLAAQAKADGIDILVECNGWTKGYRLPILTPRLAPVQMTYLGYPATTGVASIDWRIVDHRTDPVGSEGQSTEKLARLDGCFLCFSPLEGTPEVTETDVAASTRAIRFGSFNRVPKHSSLTVDLWCGVMRAVPASILALKLSVFTSEMRERYLQPYARLGIDPARVVLVPFAPSFKDHMNLYSRLDVALDSSPYNGTTTTCEALWMGVPVIALRGSTHRARVSASLLEAAGVPELIAESPEKFVSLARDLAHDRARLAEYRRALRTKMAGSTLVNPGDHARRFAAVLRQAWRAWCGASVAG